MYIDEIVLGKIAKPLKKMLKKLASEEVQAQLAVADSKLGGIIREGTGNRFLLHVT